MSLFELSERRAEVSSKPGRFGPYYCQELINSGGMADLWMATDQSGAIYAVRKLHDRLRFNLLARRRFVRGCEILAKIHKHEQVIGYNAHGKISGTLYLAMEYVEGSNLKLLLGRSDPALTENVADILIDMAAALEHVHDSGFMHLDFKPENILVTRNGSIRLVDFDLARPRPEKPKKLSRNPGTPAYMAPEQLLRQPVDHRADIFSFGVTAYEVLTYTKPFAGETAEEIVRKELNGNLRSPRDVNPELPPALEKIVMKCLERDPDKRYSDMSIVVHELKQALYV